MSPEWQNTLLRVMLESSLRVCLLAVAVGGILLLARVRSGGVRHAAWSAVLAAMLLMPVLPYYFPTIEVPLPSHARRVEAIPAAIESAWTEPDQPLIEPPGVSTAAAPVVQSPVAAGPAATVAPRVVWPLVVFGIYAVGLLFLLARLLLGWLAMRRIVDGSRCLSSDVGGPPFGANDSGLRLPDSGLRTSDAGLYECSLIATPVTIGVFAPKILLPSAWKLWPETKLRAVLAHELAHVRRRDPLIALLARLNLCLFWFHPVAWWLEKQLATTAEHACDDVGLRVMGEKRRYAEVLLDMAEAVRRAGGRLSWDGVGVHGSGLLGQRIDRVLRGELFREVSMTRKVIVAISCAIAILIVVACRQQPTPPAPLKPNPQVEEERKKQQVRSDEYKAADAMTAQQVADLEAAVTKNPEDLAALEKLLLFYRPVKVKIGDAWMARCAAVVGEKECVAARRGHILWLIEHHPDNDLAGSWGARIFTTALDPLPDPVGYEQAKKLWLAQVSRRDATAKVFGNAAYFFEVPDKPLAETMLLRAQAADPGGHWGGALGRLYYLVLVGSNASTPLNVVWTNNLADTHRAYAQQVREKLGQTSDTSILLGAAHYLIYSQLGDKVDFDTRALGRSYIDRALQIDSQSPEAHRLNIWARQGDRSRRLYALLKGVPPQSQYAKVAALPEPERFELLPLAAVNAWFEGDNAGYYRHDGTAQKAAWERASRYARDMLQLAPKFKDRAEYGAAILQANATLGLIAFREGGDTQIAVNYARAAANAPSSDILRYSGDDFPLRWLLGYLLRHGERDSVIACLEKLATTDIADRKTLLVSADQIRRGVMPVWYSNAY